MTFYRETGSLIFGTRLKRLSDRFLLDVAKTYRHLDIPFETSWFPLFYLLAERDSLSVTDIARELEITHSAVSQLVTAVGKKGYVSFSNDQNDKRRRLVRFSPKGREMMRTIRPVWEALEKTMGDLLQEGEHSAGLFDALDELEDRLSGESLFQRMLNEINRREPTEKDINR